MTLGQKLKDLRQALNLSQLELAKKAKVGTSTIVYAEAVKGEKRPARYATLRFETLRKIAESLGVDGDSKEFQELAILWLEEQLGTAISTARARKACKNASASGATNAALERLVETASQNLEAEAITLLEWAANEPGAIGSLRTLKAFQDGQKKQKSKPARKRKK